MEGDELAEEPCDVNKTQLTAAGLEDGKGGQQPRNAEGSKSQKRQRNGFPPPSPPQGLLKCPAGTVILAQEDLFLFLVLR